MSIILSLAVGFTAPALNSNEAGKESARVEHGTLTSLYTPVALTPRDDNTIVWTWKDGIRFQTEDGQVKGKLGGRIQLDGSGIDADKLMPGTTSLDGFEFRRARLFIQLDWDDWGMKAQYDFAGGDVDFKDVFIARKDAVGSADLKIGHFKEPFSLGELTSSKYITFMERSLNNALTVGRNIGVALNDTWGDSSGTWAAGIFRQDTGDDGIAVGTGNMALTGRGTWTPVYNDGGESLVHVGLGYSIRDNDMVRIRQRPELHLSDRFIDTGTLMSDHLHLGNLELGGVLGAFHTSFEYMMAEVAGDGGASDADFSGYNLQFGYFLTGESRPYKRSTGTWDRVRPNNRFSKGSGKGAGKKGGMGAMETAIRFSSLDLDDGPYFGGKEDNISLAFNWYLTPNLRWGVNYIMGDIEYQGAADADFRAIGTRLQVDW